MFGLKKLRKMSEEEENTTNAMRFIFMIRECGHCYWMNPYWYEMLHKNECLADGETPWVQYRNQEAFLRLMRKITDQIKKSNDRYFQAKFSLLDGSFIGCGITKMIRPITDWCPHYKQPGFC